MIRAQDLGGSGARFRVWMPSTTAQSVRHLATACALVVAPVLGLGAQTQPPAPSRPSRDTSTLASPRDSAARAARGPRRTTRAGAAPRAGLRPPVSPRRAFLSSLLVPGLGQSRLQRPTAGAVFAGVEMAAVVMVGKSLADLRAAKAFRADSVPGAVPVDATGKPTGTTPMVVAPFTNDLVRARRLHLEDWIAAIAFNHLISGAEAFVSANLYDLPAQISARPTPRGGAVTVSLAW